MLKILQKIFSPPEFETETEKTKARYLYIILGAGIIILTILIAMRPPASGRRQTNIVLAILALAMLGMIAMLKRGKVQTVAFLLMAATWITMTYMAWNADGIRDVSLIAYLGVILLADLLGSTRLSIFFTALSIISFWGFVYLEKQAIITPTLEPITNLAIDLSFIFVIVQVITYLTIQNLNKALESSKKQEELSSRNQELLDLQENLEQLVEERTSALQKSAESLQKQARQLQAISIVSEKIALVQNLDKLLPEITHLTSNSFNFYHVGIFLISPNGQFAQLKAANSEGGKRMLARNHQLEVGKVGIVGRVASDAKPRIALNVGEEAVYFNNPDLPETNSEMALPLLYGKNIVGVLDVQSKKKNAFNKDDLDIFSTLANQIAIAIENTRQLERTQNALAEIEEVSKKFIRQEWTQLAKKQRIIGYRYQQGETEKLTKEQPIQNTEESAILNVPVKLRDEIIGILKIRGGENDRVWQQEDMDLVEEIADRAALALENARLLENTSRRAGRERLVSEITTKIRSTTDPQEMIATTLKELKEALQASNVALVPHDAEEK